MFAEKAPTSRLSLATIAAGVREGTTSPSHGSHIAAGNPDSVAVGVSGNSGSRMRAVTDSVGTAPIGGLRAELVVPGA